MLSLARARAASGSDAAQLAAASARRFGLTPRETEVLGCALRGDDVAAFCEGANITPRTYRARAQAIIAKTGATSLQDFAMSVLREALRSPS